MSKLYFPKTYFTGTQTKILLNGKVLIGEAVGIIGEYSMEPVPVYGYASQHFNTVGMGRGIAFGQITINYVQNGYLYALINKSKATESEGKESIIEEVDYTSFNKEYEAFVNSLYARDEVIENLRGQYWNDGIDPTDYVHPEFRGPLTLDIYDFRIGTENLDALSMVKEEAYERKTIKDVYISKMSTARMNTAQATQDTYSFIGKIII